MTERPWSHLSGEELRKRLKRADYEFDRFIDQLYIRDPEFKKILDLALALEDEQAARRNKT